MSNSTIPQAAEDKHVPIGEWKLSAEVYDRIIDAVGEEPKDRDKLVFDLLSARAQLLRFMFLDSDKGAKARKKLFSDISNQAIALKDNLLANEEYAARALFPDVSRGLTFLRELHRIVEEAKVSEQQNSKGAWERLERSLPDWFAAEILSDVFKGNFPAVHDRHPGEPVGFSRPSRGGQAGGPFIRFAVAVMGEMGMSIKPNTVARALENVRDGCARRQARPPITQLQSK